MGARMLWRLLLLLLVAASAREAPVAEGGSGDGGGDDGVVALRHGGRVAPVRLACCLAYFAIPYAKPPLGHLRFKAPQPVEPWSGVRRPEREGNSCMQDSFGLLLGTLPTSEDCLFLNVYTDTMAADVAQPRPVMVWLHGGAFAIGSGSRFMYGPDYLAARGVLLVTLNYRLGPFGFLSTADAEAPGNMGLKDQALALGWVRDNIAAFGGDPHNVTIFGESAGAASVHLHMLSPASRGLFSRAISQSGSALSPWATVDAQRAREAALALGAAVGCHGNQSAALVDCLRGVPATDLSAAAARALTDRSPDQLEYSPFQFLPVVEDFLAAGDREDAFLHGDPRELMRLGLFAKVPFIAGINSNEALPFARFLMMRQSSWAPGGKGYPRLLPPRVRESCEGPRLEEAAARLRSFYLRAEDLDEDSFTEMMSDALFFDGIQETVELFAASSSSPVYEYLFEVDGERNLLKRLMSNAKKAGACHADDLGYLFSMQLPLLPAPAPSSLEELTIERMTTMWTDFAKTGDPTPRADEGDGGVATPWLPYDATSQNFLRIGRQLSLEQHLWADRRHFWSNLTC
ncbi:juvenile hormone esterase-like [Schistocerca gregaria]|uniref:juvenile hormone esterase-like n=1 Tax=Schistocerca gregaria TaxID=7010 RepID=UPI00211F04D6|nr:juvenile hormone esterase-like [Schistocerca gregaria]